MPSTSAKQARTMAAAAHDPGVAKDFNKADKGTGIRKKKKRPSHAKSLYDKGAVS